MKTAREIVFALVMVAILFIPIANVVANRVVPGYKSATESQLEARKYQVFPEVNLETVSGGTFQDEFEQYIADKVVKRDDVLILQAWTQGVTIDFANLPFGFASVPTHFGSAILHNQQWNSILPTPQKQTAKLTKQLNDAAKAINTFTEHYPDITWRMILVDNPQISLGSPAHDTVADPADYDYYKREFLDKLTTCEWIDVSNTTPEQYYERYFKTDHHWLVQGGLEGYAKLMESLGNEADTFDITRVYDGPFYGSNARKGMCDRESDVLDEIVYPEGATLKVKVNGKDAEPSDIDASYAEGFETYTKANKFTNVYADYFHDNYKSMTLTNPNAATDRTLLLLGDSYTNNIERLFTAQYRTVYVLDSRYFKGGIQSFIDEHDVDDAAFIWAHFTATSSTKNLAIS